jgi:hypothetical protein
MPPRKNKPGLIAPDSDLDEASDRKGSALRDQWEAEADWILNETELRRKPDWLEAIGDEDEDGQRIETNIKDEWQLQGEDDYVSDPTAESDMPDWVDDDYDDE